MTPSAPARDIEIDNADVHAVFTTRGAVLKSWKLKKYHDAAGQPLEMIAGHAPADSPLPFTLAVDDPALSAKLAAAPFTWRADSRRACRVPQAQFDYQDETGVRAREDLHDRSGQAVRHQRDRVASRVNGQPLPIDAPAGAPRSGSGIVQHSRGYNPPPQPIFFKDGKVTRDRAGQDRAAGGAGGHVRVRRRRRSLLPRRRW